MTQPRPFQIPSDPRKLDEAYFANLNACSDLMKAGRFTEALVYAVRWLWLTPAIIRGDRMMRSNKADAIGDVVSCATQAKQPEVALPHIRWAFDARLIPARDMYVFAQQLAEDMQFDGADRPRVEAFLSSAKAFHVVSIQEAEDILAQIEW